jgi:TolA-binding protein
MDGMQQQIFTLNRKVDQLYDIVERMSHQVSTLTAQKQPPSTERYMGEKSMSERHLSERQLSRSESTRPEPFRLETEPLMISDSYNSGSYSQGMMEHKDILQDDPQQGNATSSSDANWSADIQIRRLTAQLTAAYNRIAALEEQLLSYRIHS